MTCSTAPRWHGLTRFLLASTLWLLGAAGSAYAEPATYQYSGTITEKSGAFDAVHRSHEALTVGLPFTGTLPLDRDAFADVFVWESTPKSAP